MYYLENISPCMKGCCVWITSVIKNTVESRNLKIVCPHKGSSIKHWVMIALVLRQSTIFFHCHYLVPLSLRSKFLWICLMINLEFMWQTFFSVLVSGLGVTKQLFYYLNYYCKDSPRDWVQLHVLATIFKPK